MADVRVICAIGKSGQLGLGGHMPWEGNPDREYREDVERFFEITRGHVVVCGPRTAAHASARNAAMHSAHIVGRITTARKKPPIRKIQSYHATFAGRLGSSGSDR